MTNHPNCARISPMVAELRRVGKHLALYTDDTDVYRRVSHWKIARGTAPYLQGKKVVGMDVYFHPRARKAVERVLKGQMALNL